MGPIERSLALPRAMTTHDTHFLLEENPKVSQTSAHRTRPLNRLPATIDSFVRGERNRFDVPYGL